MPIYDFQCGKCGHKFTILISLQEKDQVKCPECQSQDVKQLFTGFNFLRPSGSDSGCNTGGGGFT